MKNETFTPERIKAEADAFFEWDGEDRSLVTTTSCLLFAQHIAGLMQARAAQPEPVVPEGSIYVECRQCDKCQHVGINDAAHGLAACHDCDWSGNEPEDDKCPGCKSENCMAAACPECGARYALIASEDVAAAPAQGQQVDSDASRCKTIARLMEMVSQRDAELSALKAQQVGQEPAVPECVERIRTLLPRFEAGVNWTGEDAAELAEAAYDAAELLTTKPAPDQDVTAVLKMARALSDRQADACNVDREDQWKLYSEDFVADVEAMLAAAHDKQSGEVKP